MLLMFCIVSLLSCCAGSTLSSSHEDSELMSSYMHTNLLQVDASHNRPRPLPTRSFQLVGSTSAEIADKLNEYAKNHVSVQRVIPCADLDEASISTLASKLRPHVIDDISQLPPDDGRRIEVKPWEISEGLTRSARRRDMMCAETMKMWAHHIPNPAKVAQLEAILPSLPAFNRTELLAEEQDEFLFYNRSLSCVIGHNVVDWNEALGEDDTNYTGWPVWPKKLHYSGVSFGPYPFWNFGGRVREDGWHVNMPYDTPASHGGVYVDGNELEVWHSTPLMRSKLFHKQCHWLWGGHPELGDSSCAALQVGPYGLNGGFYLYTVNETTKMSDENFCCEFSFSSDYPKLLGTLNRKFVESMTYLGEHDLKTMYYSGPAKVYVVALTAWHPVGLPLDVYYWTDLEGKPLRFGEADSRVNKASMIEQGVLKETDLPLIYEEFDPTSYADEELQDFPDSILDLPEVCTERLEHCSPGHRVDYYEGGGGGVIVGGE